MMQLCAKVKGAVQSWRNENYKGASAITKRLLEFWFLEDHILADGSDFGFWDAQREAIESLIYVYEVCGYGSLYQMARGFGVSVTFDPTADNWPKYCFKMATGSGKTFVMALAIVWQFFNDFFRTENGRRYTSKFVVIAPNLIVLDRLNEAFANGAIFKDFPFVPPEWDADFDLQMVFQSQVSPQHSRGILYLTNVQQLYEVDTERAINALDEALGPRVKKDAGAGREHLQEALHHHDQLLIINDEAHHVHSPELEWAKSIDNLHRSCLDRGGRGLTMQLDFSATPYTGTGQVKRFFPHIIYDYPLGAAIRDKIVKRPKIGIVEGATETLDRDFVRKNRASIDAGVQILREFQRDFKASGMKPVLFVMTDNTRNADKVGRYLEYEHNLTTLVIHTDKKGVITKKDLEQAREAARSIDTNEYQAIVSVMMLKEGWDVKNVCVIVPLRKFDSPILAEQTLGRGLRRMSPHNQDWQEKLLVVDHERFRDLWNAEIKEGELDIEITSAKDAYKRDTLIMVDQKKIQYDFGFPVLMGGITRDVKRISQLRVDDLPKSQFRFGHIEAPRVMLTEKDLLTQKVEAERELLFDYTDRYDVFLAKMTRAILSRCSASAHFAEVLPKVKEYIQTRLFDQKIDIKDPETVKKLNNIEVREKVRDVFVDAIRRLEAVEEPYQLTGRYQLSQTKPYHTSLPVYEAEKTVFDRLPYPHNSRYESHFMRYLDEDGSILAYTKIFGPMPLKIPYYKANGYAGLYTPDFLVRTRDGFWLIETKGAIFDEPANVELKAQAAREWCKKVTELTGESWSYAKILQEDFHRLRHLRPLELFGESQG